METSRKDHGDGPSKSSSNVFVARVAPLHSVEHRYVIFRSDRAGAIAKIVFSIHKLDCSAVIHVLEVKPEYRGCDLGGLLVHLAFRTISNSKRRLRHTCPDESRDSNDDVIIECRLEAEEDMRRHNKLIQFYEKLGCDVRSDCKVQYLYHDNDHEVFQF